MLGKQKLTVVLRDATGKVVKVTNGVEIGDQVRYTGDTDKGTVHFSIEIKEQSNDGSAN